MVDWKGWPARSARIRWGVSVKRKDGSLSIIKPVTWSSSPLDVAGIDTDLSAQEILGIAREGRER